MKFDEVIKSNRGLFDLQLSQIKEYKDLIGLLVRRDFVVFYKQTLLGPMWYLIQPVLSTITYMIIFGSLANLGTSGIPQPLFYFSGTMLWSFFTASINKSANTFVDNKSIFGKIYFPRIVSPIASAIGQVIKLFIQYILFLIVYFYYCLSGVGVAISWKILLIPVVVLWIGVLALGLGMVIAAITTKYRDVGMMLNPLLALIMYVTPVVYPYSEASDKLKILLWINPMSAPIEFFRFCYFETKMVSVGMNITSVMVTLIMLILGLIIFRRNERTFIDVI